MSEASAPKPKLLRWGRIGVWAALGGFALLLVAGLAVRFGVQTQVGAGFVAAQLNGLSLGRFGRLHIEGLHGDLWGDFSLDRLTITDRNGVWLDARRLQVRWRPVELLERRVHVTDATAAQVQVVRRPVLEPAGPPQRLPAAVAIDHAALEVETQPAASGVRGAFALSGALDVERNSAFSGAVQAASRLHPGDGFSARFDFGVHERLALNVQAREAKGGALAGLLGLPAAQAFLLDAEAGGAKGNGWLHLRALSGQQSIAQADGTWTAAGGQAAGRLSLAASRLTAPMMARLGPEVRFSAAGRPAGNGLYGVALFARADNTALQAAGVADPVTLTARNGLAVQASVNDLRRFVASPAMGRAAFNGRLTGGWADAHLTGNVVVEQLSLGGYALARASGPVDLVHAKGSWRLKADAAGDQGRGAGLLAALIGGRPHASLDATRLADGRILIQSLKAAGAGLSVDAAGQQGLFGDLSFKGDLKLSNLAAARIGAHGQIEARWSAAQARPARPWTFDFNAQGAGFASGFAELDRLLGPKPSLQAQGAYDRGDFAIAKADLAGLAASAHAAGQIAKDGGLKLAIKWTARGPFTAGPVEIAGQAQGSGALTGSLAAPRADLLADFEQIALPDLTLKPAHAVLSFVRGPNEVNGSLALTASSDYGPAHARANFHFVQSGLALSGIDAAGGGVTAEGALTLARATASVADLTLSAGPGAVLAQGHADARLKIVDSGGEPTLSLALKARDASLRDVPLTATAITLNADGPLSHAPYTISGDLQWSGTPFQLQGGGVAARAGPAYAVSFEGSGKLRKAEFRTLTPALVSLNGPDRSAKASLAFGAGRIDLDARQTGHHTSAAAKLANIDVAALDGDFAGTVDGGLTMDGQDQALNGTLTAHLAGARVRDAPAKLAMDGDLKASLAGERLDVAATAQNQAGGHASVTVSLSAESSASPFRVAIAKTQPLSGKFDIEGEIEPVWQLLFGGGRTLAGQANAQGQIAGTLNDPRVVGHATLAAGRFEDSTTGLKLRNVAADATLNDNVLVLNALSASDAKSGTLKGQGQLGLASGGQSNLTLTVHAFQLLDNETASATASGVVTLSRDAAGKAKFAGALTIDRAEISARTSRAPPGVVRMDVVERNRPGTLDRGVQAPNAAHALTVGLDIKLSSSGGIFVRGLGLDAEMSLDASVTGDTAHPLLEGSAHVVRGDYQFAGQRFQFDNSGVVYLASSPSNIRLDLTATREDPSLTAIITIKGTAAKPEITLSSSPTLPSDEVLAQTLFGRSAAQLSPVEAAQLAAAVTTLASGGGFDVMGGLQNFARLDRLALGGDTASGVTVSGGKYIGKRVYLELTGGGRQGPSAEVDVRAARGLSLVSQIGGEAGAKLAIRWRHDYGRSTNAPARP